MDKFEPTILRLEEVGSTNDFAKQMAIDATTSLDQWIIVRADRQTQGRGRGSNAWWSDPGSLTFSVLLDPVSIGLADRHTPLSSLATAVSVIDAVLPWINRGSIALRWPNDVEIDGRKIAGILPERVNSPLGPRLIIGVGLNVRSRLDDGPSEVRRMAAALSEFSDRTLNIEDQEAIFDALLLRLHDALTLLASDDLGLSQRWGALDQLLGQPVRIDLGGEIVNGVGRGIGTDGGLRVEDSTGIRTFYGGRILRDF